MLSPATVASAVGAPKSVADFQARIERWYNLYAATPVPIVFDTINGTIRRDRLTMKLPSRICEDWAGLMWGENSYITGSPLVEEVMGDEFASRLLSHIEGTMGLGTGGMEVIADFQLNAAGTITGFSNLYIDTCEATNIYPLSWDRGRIRSAAFVSFEDKKTFSVRIHSHDGERGTIENKRFRSWGNAAREMPLDDGVAPLITYQGPPMFVVWFPAVRNAYWPKGPFGVSVLDRPADTFEVLDSAFDNLHADIVLGRKMIMMPETMLKKTATGYLPPQQDRTQLFVSMNDPMADGSQRPVEFNPDLRVGENTQAIETALSLIGEMVGMGSDRYRYRDGSLATATQIISEQSVTWRNRAKHLRGLVNALTVMGEAVSWLGQTFLRTPAVDVEVVLDDSIVVDEGTNLAEGRALHAAGLISTERFLGEYLHLDGDDLTAEVERLSQTPLF